jgi:chromosome segregation ATPase
MTAICPVHADTVRSVEKQAERTDSLFIDVAAAQSGLAKVDQKATELRADHEDLVEKVEIIDGRVRNLEKFQAAANETIRNVADNLQRANAASSEFSNRIVDMDKRISIMAIKVAGIIGGATMVISAIVTVLVNYIK